MAWDGRPAVEAWRLARLVRLFSRLPAPPNPLGLYPRAATLQQRLLATLASAEGERIEEAFLELYAHLHGHEAPYTAEERQQVRESGGYWCHAGGLAPILKAPDFLHPNSVSIDLGAGNGLQLLLMQLLARHRRSVQVEISSRLLAAGRALAAWLGVGTRRLDWRHQDVRRASLVGCDFVYLYRPVKPDGPGASFYQHLVKQLMVAPQPVVVFSIADCLGEFLPSTVAPFYTDGQLTCYRLPGRGGAQEEP